MAPSDTSGPSASCCKPSRTRALGRMRVATPASVRHSKAAGAPLDGGLRRARRSLKGLLTGWMPVLGALHRPRRPRHRRSSSAFPMVTTDTSLCFISLHSIAIAPGPGRNIPKGRGRWHRRGSGGDCPIGAVVTAGCRAPLDGGLRRARPLRGLLTGWMLVTSALQRPRRPRHRLYSAFPMFATDTSLCLISLHIIEIAPGPGR
mmetsp:Transcript_89112/g.288162  ORF Transcript_89112/g.288162 Transcript_89112/m.288162 type:complete len:204 (-) Transcript_89112:114-725(-)